MWFSFLVGGVFDWLVNKAVIAERVIIGVRQDDMVGYLCTEEGQRVNNLLCQLLVGRGGCEAAGWVIVD